MDYSISETSYQEAFSSMFKITTIFLSIMIALIVITVDTAFLMNIKSKYMPENLAVVDSFSYQSINSDQLGNTFTPTATLPLSINGTSKSYDFLIDSGAIASSIPQKEASQFNLDLATLPRILIQGVTSIPTYGYVATGKIELKEANIDVPIILADVNHHIIGITGLFDKHTIIFDHQTQSVTIAKSK